MPEGEKTKSLWDDPDYREKMSKAHRGKPTWNKGKRGAQTHSQETRDRIGRAAARRERAPTSEATREKISRANKGKPGMRGEKNPRWKGGQTPGEKLARRAPLVLAWRAEVFKRDGYTCQKCQERGGLLRAHHVLNFSTHPDLRFILENGITLCDGCHVLFHKLNGKTKNNREQLTRFLEGQ